MNDDFFIESRFEPNDCYVECSGELDIATTPKFADTLHCCLDRNPATLHLDLSHVTLMTSSGITILMAVLQWCREKGITYELTLSPHVRRILDLVGLWWVGVIDDGIEVDAELECALRTYGQLPPEERARGSETAT
jgi:anti-anti-sigma factor